MRYAIGTAGEVIRFGHDPFGDIDVGSDQEVGLDILEDEIPVLGETAAYPDFGRCPPHCLEGLLEGQDQTAGPARGPRHEYEEGLELRVLLAAKCTARVRGQHANPVQG